MPHLIDFVAALIDLRDRDDLEFTLASVMLELVGGSALYLWRAYQTNDGVGYDLRVRLVVDPKLDPYPGKTDGAWVTLDELGDEARAAFSSRKYSSRAPEDGGVGRYAAPVLSGAEALAVVEIVASPPIDAEMERLISALIRIYRSHLGVLNQGEVDELTGLANRKPFHSAFQNQGPPPRRASAPSPLPLWRAELAVVDIDHFKRVNDTFGHPYGDEVLVLLSGLMRDSFRPGDQLFRFGGEEFVILLSGSTAEGAEGALERFRRKVESFAFPQVGRVTVSLGVTTVRAGESGADAFGRADEALYLAKRSGRNQLLRYETLIADGRLTPRQKQEDSIEVF